MKTPSQNVNSTTANRKSKATMSRIRAMRLEPRMLFDGAAVDTAVDVLDTSLIAPIDAPVPAPVEQPLFNTDGAPEIVQTAAQDAEAQIKDFLNTATDEELFALFNGGKTEPDAEWAERLASLREALKDGSFTVNVVEMDSASQFTAIAAFTAEGPNGQPTIFINRYWFDMFDAPDATRALVEELGHAIDRYLNPGSDTAGDEGTEFASTVIGSAPVEGFANGRETGTVEVNGESYEVEFATFNFVTAYQMVYDLDNDTYNSTYDKVITTADIDVSERWADKEQNSHYFNTAALGKVTIDDNNYNGKYFSGNDVSAIGLNIGGTDYFGWVSRPIKSGGVVRGFYFWTDTDFTNLATAQADGNRDTDGSVLDNKGFLLVVDQQWFTDQITATGVAYNGVASSTPLINNTKDGNLGSITLANVGSSSDRVDSALNALVDSNAPPVAVADTTSGTPDASSAGRPVLEQGYNSNTSSEITATVNATGNVLANDTDVNNATNPYNAALTTNTDSLTVSTISSVSTGDAKTVSGSGSFVVTGKYGSLTIYANGNYSYAVNNSNPTVNALGSYNSSDASTYLTEQFSYKTSDGKGGTSAATTLTIQINGSNDAPVAANDYNTAKEITTSSNTGYTATAGALPDVKNVLANDTDVDSGDTKIIQGVQINGGFTAGTVTIVAPSSNLTFTTTESSFNSSTISGKSFYYYDGTTYRLVHDASGNAVTAGTASSTTVGGVEYWTVPLSSAPSYYNSTGSTSLNTDDVLITDFSNKAVIFSTGTAETATATGSAKTATAQSSSTVRSTVNVPSTINGTLAVGMTLTNSSSGSFTAGTKISALYFTSGVLTSIGLDKDVSFSSGASLTFSGTSTLSQELQGAHGKLVLNSNGSYTYTPTTDNSYLSSGQSAVEVFDYTMQDAAGVTSAAKLYITVYGSGSNDPVVVADNVTVYESGVGRTPDSPGTATSNPNDPFLGQNVATSPTTGTTTDAKTITYNVLTNDTPGAGGAVASYTMGDGINVTVAGSQLTGAYGNLTISSAGAVTYTVRNDVSAVKALLPGSNLSETFLYKVTNTALGVNFSQLTITITGTNDAPVAVADTTAVSEDSVLTATGNVLSNDTDDDAGDTKVVSRAGTTIADGTVDASTTSADGLLVAGTYGNLTIGADGTYRYVLATSGAQYTLLQALAQGATESEVFTYEVKDTNGATHTNTLTITVTGANEPPINQFNGTAISSTASTSVTTAANTAIDFTGTKLLSVADADTNLSTITLEVEHGTLSFTSTPLTVTLSASTGKTITISAGTQPQLNAALALLRYTPDNNYTGSDFLSINSADVLVARDIDGIAINIPTNTTATVSEPALSSGTLNSSSADETFPGNLTLATGQTVNTQQTGNILDGSSNVIGNWQVNTNGTFSVTLTTASNATSSSFSYVVYDSYGNAVNNTVAVTITDDAPVANADTGSITEDASTNTVTGNVITGTGTGSVADTASADGSTTVAGVAAGTTNANLNDNTKVSADITGSYGKINIASDGSYTYTLDNSNPTVNALNNSGILTDSFTYTIRDNDGSLTHTTVTITINGSTDVAGAPTLTITDNNSTSTGQEPVVENATLTGKTFTVSATNGLAKITIGTTDVTLAQLNSVGTTPISPINTSQGALTITGYNSGTGIVTYSYDPTGTRQDHTSGEVTDAIGITVTDNSNLTASGTLTLLITDTTVTANDDSDAVIEDSATTATGNVITAVDISSGSDANSTDGVGDTLAADAATVTGVQAGSVSTEISAGAASAIAGTYGHLTINANGDYTYTLYSSNDTGAGATGYSALQAIAKGETQTDTFSYTLKDADGDFDNAAVAITISGTNDSPVITAVDVSGNVTEDASIVADNPNTGTTETGGFVTDSGSVTFDDVDLSDTSTVTVALVGAHSSSSTAIPVSSALRYSAMFDFAAILGNTGANWPGTSDTKLYKNAYPSLTNAEFIALGYELMSQSTGTAGEIGAFVINYTNNTQTTVDYLITKASLSGLYNKSASTDGGQDGGTITGQQVYVRQVDLAAAESILSRSATVTSPSGGLADLGATFKITGAGIASAANDGTVNWSFALDNSKIQDLKAGETITVTYRITVTDDSGVTTASSGDQINKATQLVTVTIAGTNDAPVIDLDTADTSTVNHTATFDAGGSAVAFASGVTNLTDADSTTFDKLTLSWTASSFPDGTNEHLLVSGATSGGTISGLGTLASGGSITLASSAVVNYTVSTNSGVVSLVFTGAAGAELTQAQAEELIDALRYENTAAQPTTGNARVFSLKPTDGEATDGNTATFNVTVAIPSTLSIDDVTVNEAAGNAVFTVTRGGTNTTTAVSVAYATSSGTATSGTDFTATSGTLSFASGETSKQITVPISNDGVYEGSEIFNVTLSNATAATISDGAGLGAIKDDGTGNGGTDDDRPTFSVADVTVSEGGVATFTVSRTGASDVSQTVDVATLTLANPDTAEANDFTALSTTTLTFAAGVTTQTFTVQTTQDTTYEGAETFRVQLANATSGALISTTNGTATGTIVDDGRDLGGGNTADDDRPTFSVADVTVSEGGVATFTVSRTGASDVSQTVDVATLTLANPDTAEANDFTALSTTTLTFAAGVTTQTFTVQTTQDTTYEGAETFRVQLANATSGALISTTNGTATGTIVDDGRDLGGGNTADDDRPTFSVADVTVSEGGVATFTVSRTGASDVSQTVDVATLTLANPDTAEANDFTALSTTTLTFAAGVTTQTFTVQTTQDTTYEGAETFRVQLANATSGALISTTNGTATGTIVDDGRDLGGGNTADDDRPTFSVADVTVSEGGVATFTVSRTGASDVSQTVDVATLTLANPDTAEANDFTALSTTTLTFAAGVTTQTFTVQTTQDTTYEGAETFRVQLANATSGALISTTNGTATGTIVDDGRDLGGGNTADDDRPTFSVADVTVSEGGVATFTVSRTGASDVSQTVDVATLTLANPDTAEANDFTALSTTTLTFAAGVTTQTFTVQTTQDTTYEGAETFRVQLANATSGALISTTNGTATGTIVDDGRDLGGGNTADDDRPTFSVADVTVSEGGVATFTVSRTGASDVSQTVDVATLTLANPDTAEANDFTALSTTTLTFAAGVTTQTFTVQTTQDTTYEGAETFRVQLANATSGALISTTNGTATGTIVDDGRDLGGGNTADDDRPTFSVADVTVSEGGVATFTVSRTGASDVSQTVDVATLTLANPDTAEANDFTALSTTTLTFAAGVTTQTFTVQTTQDTTYEGAETFRVQLANATSGALISTTNGTATGTIVDDGRDLGGGNTADDDRPTFSVADVTVSEGGVATFTVSRTGASDVSQTVDVATLTLANPDTAEANDFTALSTTTLTFAAGVTTQTFTVQTTQDTTYEGAETFRVQLANATSGALISTTNGTATGTIVDDGRDLGGGNTADDDRPTFSVADVTVSEGGVATFTVSRTGASDVSQTVDVATLTLANPDTAEANDFTALSTTTLTFAAGVTTQTFTVQTTQDTTYEGAETFRVQLANATSGALISTTNGTATGTIVDDGRDLGGGNTADDDRPTFSVADVTVSEGGVATFTVSRTGASDVSQTVDVATLTLANPDTAEANDFTALSTTTLTFAAGVTTQTFTVQTTQDTTYEGAETFRVQLANATSGALISTTNGTATGTIVDDGRDLGGGNTADDDRPTFSVADVTVSEGGVATFTVSRTGASDVSQTVDVATLTLANPDTAEANDFTALSTTTLTFAAGVTTQTFTVQTTQDTTYEGAETFRVQLANATSGALISTTNGTATGTIVDDGRDLGGGNTADDDRAITVFGLDDVSEGSNAVFTVNLPDGNLRNTEISLALSDGTANSADYSATFTAYYYDGNNQVALTITDGKVTLPSGVTTFYVKAPTTQDTTLEGAENFSLTATITGGKSANDTSTIVDDGTGKIYDDKGANGTGPGNNDTPLVPDAPPPPTAPIVPENQAPEVSFSPDQHVLDAVADAQGEASESQGGSLPTGESTFLNGLANTLSTDISLHVLPAVQTAQTDSAGLSRQIQLLSGNVFAGNGFSGSGLNSPLESSSPELFVTGAVQEAQEQAAEAAAASSPNAQTADTPTPAAPAQPAGAPASNQGQGQDSAEADEAEKKRREAAEGAEAAPGDTPANGNTAPGPQSHRGFSEQIRQARQGSDTRHAANSLHAVLGNRSSVPAGKVAA